MFALEKVISILSSTEKNAKLNEKEKQIPRGKAYKFESIKLENISYAYDPKDTKLLDSYSITIRRGDKIIIKGKTGSGKSTLLDIMMGLVQPTNGKVIYKIERYNDQKSIEEITTDKYWDIISYVPQKIILQKGTIEENIAFTTDTETIDREKVRKCARISCIDDFIETLPKKYETVISENSSNISGGQTQRIAIARALYREPEVLFLDEATSALDMQTNTKLMDNILCSDDQITIIKITHQEQKIKGFSKYITLKSE